MKKLLLLSSILLLSACQQSNIEENILTTAVADQTSDAVVANSPETNLVENIEHVLAVKPNTNSLKFTHRESSPRAKVGVPFEIEIDFDGVADSELQAKFSTTPGLSLISNSQASLRMKANGKADTHTLKVLPQQEGVYFLTIVDTQAVNQKPQAIKIIVGDKEASEYLQTPGEVLEQEDGSKVISMKADEG